jgi:Protein of unknown function (DUF3224)
MGADGRFPADWIHDAMKIFRSLVGAMMCATLGANAAEATSPVSTKASTVTTHTASGPFDIQLSPQPPTEAASRAGLGRMTLDKRFHGALEATSAGEMLSFRSAVAGSAGYVAMETVRGTLDGRTGSFVLQHSSTMDRGVPTQSITVVPDSGTGALARLAGRMTIDIGPGGAHAYRFEYTLPDAAP